jgi:hypothetical protein
MSRSTGKRNDWRPVLAIALFFGFWALLVGAAKLKLLPEEPLARTLLFVVFGLGLLCLSVYEIASGTALYRTGENRFVTRSSSPAVFWVVVLIHMMLAILIMVLTVCLPYRQS